MSYRHASKQVMLVLALLTLPGCVHVCGVGLPPSEDGAIEQRLQLMEQCTNFCKGRVKSFGIDSWNGEPKCKCYPECHSYNITIGN